VKVSCLPHLCVMYFVLICVLIQVSLMPLIMQLNSLWCKVMVLSDSKYNNKVQLSRPDTADSNVIVSGN